MSVRQDIANVLSTWGEEISRDLDTGVTEALKKGGRKNPNAVALKFDQRLIQASDLVTLEIIAVSRQGKSAAYWRNIEEGRRAGAKQPPSEVVGKQWQNANAIDPRKILTEMRAKKGLKASKKKLNYDAAAKSLSFMIARSIKRKGIKPKPYVNQVLTEGRINKLRDMLTPVLGPHFKLVIKGLA